MSVYNFMGHSKSIFEKLTFITYASKSMTFSQTNDRACKLYIKQSLFKKLIFNFITL